MKRTALLTLLVLPLLAVPLVQLNTVGQWNT